MKSSCVLFLFFISAQYCDAQGSQMPQKIGHADWDYIFSQLPEYKQIENELKIFEAQLQNQLKINGQELETKYRAYKALPEDTPEAVKKDKETELAYLQENIQKFQQELRLRCRRSRQTCVIRFL